MTKFEKQMTRIQFLALAVKNASDPVMVAMWKQKSKELADSISAITIEEAMQNA